MRVLQALALLGAASTVCAEIRSSKDPQVPPAYPIGQVNEPFAKVSGRLFDVNGTVGYFSGTNAWYLGHLSSNEDVMKALTQIAETGYKIIRVWGFGDVSEIPKPEWRLVDPDRVWYQLINRTGGYINYGEDGLQRMDFLVSQCELLGLKLVLPFVNTWPDWGGVKVYREAFTEDWSVMWYDIPEAQQIYKDFVKVMVTRYKKSAAIFSWQLGNEPRCELCGNTDVVYKWAKEISQYIKSLDPDHMVSLGDEGWLSQEDTFDDPSSTAGFGYNGYNGVDFTKNFEIDTLDYGTVHLYPSLWSESYSWGVQWIRHHDEIGARKNKPIILEEYGAPAPGQHIELEKPWQEEILRSGLAADQIWQFGPKDTEVPPDFFGDDNSIYYGTPEHDVLGKQHAQNMLKKKVPERSAARR